jgi:DnaJ family protein A protein 2
MTDYYEILGVSRDADEKKIKKAYKELALKWHPDRNIDNKAVAEEKFKDISKAYAVLNDPEKKRLYDLGGEEAVQQGGVGPGINPEDIFANLFGGAGGGGFPGFFGGPRGPPQQDKSRMSSPDKQVRVSVSLVDGFKGCVKKETVRKNEKCDTCFGHGTKNKEDSVTCQQCGGKGTCVQVRQMGPMITQSIVGCQPCGGKGKVIKAGSECVKCRGKKFTVKSQAYDVTIPAGVMDGYRVQFKNESDWVEDFGFMGDLYFVVEINNTEHYLKREGVNLILNKRVHLVDALCGVDFGVRHLDNHIVHVAYNSVIKPGDCLICENEGYIIPVEQRSKYLGKSRGDLIIRFDVIFPQAFDDKRKDVLRKIISAPSEKIEGEHAHSNLNITAVTIAASTAGKNITITTPGIRREDGRKPFQDVPTSGQRFTQGEEFEDGPGGVQCATQ